MQSSMTISQPWRPLLKVLGRSLGKSLAGLALATSIVGYGLSGFPAIDGLSNAAIASTLSQPMQRSIHSPVPLSQAQESLLAERSAITFLEDGTYLYGQSSDPGEVGTAYMVFSVQGQSITGAFYMPSSSFDCFQGTIQSEELALTVHDSYSQDSFPFSVALVANEAAIASGSDIVLPGTAIEGFQPVGPMSENDQRILSTCQADLL